MWQRQVQSWQGCGRPLRIHQGRVKIQVRMQKVPHSRALSKLLPVATKTLVKNPLRQTSISRRDSAAGAIAALIPFAVEKHRVNHQIRATPNRCKEFLRRQSGIY